MQKKILNILSKRKKNIEDQKLMEYLSDKLSHEEKHALEDQMNNSELLSDAVEGLGTFSNPADIPSYVNEINRNLHLQLSQPEKKKPGRRTYELSTAYLTLGIVLIIAIVAFVILYFELLR